jgi:hypothetical protein
MDRFCVTGPPTSFGDVTMPDREFDHGRVADFRRNAEEMLAPAQASGDPDIALSYLALAAQWRRLADLVDHLSDNPAQPTIIASSIGDNPDVDGETHARP